MSFGSSKTSSSTQNQTSVQELNLQDTGGITIADNKGSTSLNYAPVTIATDENAVNAGARIAKAGISLSSDISHAALDLGEKGISTGQQLANAGLDHAAAAYQSGLTFGNNAIQVVKDLADEFSHQNASLTSDALSGYQSIAQQNSASDSTQVQKIAIYAIAAAVLIVVLPRVFK